MTVSASTLLLSGAVLAARQSSLQSPTAKIVICTIGLFCVLGAVCGAPMVFELIKQKIQDRKAARAKKPVNVFDEICEAQGLSLDENLQLLNGADALDLPSPTMLFIDPGLLNQLANSIHENAADYRTLSNRLFPAASMPSTSDHEELASNGRNRLTR